MTILLVADGKLVLNAFYKTNAFDYDGISITIFNYVVDDVDCDTLNFNVNELYGKYVGSAAFPLKILTSNGNNASGLNPHPTNIY